MATPLVIHKGRTNIVTAALAMDLSGETLTSEIRAKETVDSDLLATWQVEFETDGTDGRILMTLDNTETAGIEEKIGYMDIKRMRAGEPLSVFSEPLQVIFKDRITA